MKSLPLLARVRSVRPSLRRGSCWLSGAACLLWGAQTLAAQTVTFEQNGNGQLLETNADGDKIYEPKTNAWSLNTTYGMDSKGNSYLASISNWSTPHYPDSPSVDVDVNLPSTFDVNTTVGTLTLNSGGSLNWASGFTLTIANGSLQNDGTLAINDNPSASILAFSAAAVIGGSGSIHLNTTGGDAAMITSTAELTLSASQTIHGSGQILAPFVNNSVVTADQNLGLELGAYAMTNNDTMEAISGNTLILSQTTLTQPDGGQLLADGGTVELDGASITGGQLNSGASGSVFDGGGVTLTNVTNNATLGVADYNVSGTLTNNGVVALGGNPSASVLTFADGAVIKGPGTITMTQANYSEITTAPGGTGTQAAGHTIKGTGILSGSLVNNGAIQADGTMTLTSDAMLTNNAVVTTTATGGIESDGATLKQGANGQLIANGGQIKLTFGGSDNHATTVTGGTLNALNGGTFSAGDVTLNGVTNNATIDDLFASVGGGSLVNNGAIDIEGNPNQGTLEFPANTNLTGTGTVIAQQGTYSLLQVDSGATLTVGVGQVISSNISGNVIFNGTLRSEAGLAETGSGSFYSTDELHAGTFTNNGTFEALDGGEITLDAAATLTNFDAASQTLKGGAYRAVDGGNGATLTLQNIGVLVNAATVVLSGANASFPAINSIADNQGSFSLLGLRDFTTAGALSNEGAITLGAGSTLHVDGAFTASGSAAKLAFVIGGTASSGAQSPGVLQAAGTATLAGNLAVSFPGSVDLPSTHDTFTLLAASAINGQFADVANGARLTTSDGEGSFQVNYGAASTSTPSAVVLSDFMATSAPTITNGASATATVGEPFSLQIAATHNPTKYGVQGLFKGITVNQQTGVISGTPTAAGTHPLTLLAMNSHGTGAAALKLTVNVARPVITSDAMATATVGDAFSYQITATNSPTSYGVGGLFAGFTVNKQTGLISGTPTGTGTHTLTLQAANAGGTGTKTLTLTVNPSKPVINSKGSATARVGQPFSYQITATGDPTRYGVGGLFSGFSVNAQTGQLTGTASASETGTHTLTLQAANAGGTGTKTLTLTVTN